MRTPIRLGDYYLDHGSHPCQVATVRAYGWSWRWRSPLRTLPLPWRWADADIDGRSLRTGRLMGSSWAHCGPVKVSEAQANVIASGSESQLSELLAELSLTHTFERPSRRQQRRWIAEAVTERLQELRA